MSDLQAAEAAPVSLDSLKPRMELQGTVTKVELAGARLDVGVGTDAFMHISEIKSDKPITRLADVIKVGDVVAVYVSKVDPAQNRISVTMHKPATFGWDNLEPSLEIHDAKVVSVTRFGIFVGIDGPKDALLPHELAPRDVRYRAGDVIEKLWITEVNESKNRIGLTTVVPPALPWNKIHKGDVIKGKVVRMDRGVVYVEVGAEREGQIRRRTLDVSFVDPTDLVEMDQEVEVRVVGVNPSRKILDLALTDFNPEDYALSSGPERTISPMEAALRKAQRKVHAAAEAGGNSASKVDKRQVAQADAIARTLQHLQNQKKANQ